MSRSHFFFQIADNVIEFYFWKNDQSNRYDFVNFPAFGNEISFYCNYKLILHSIFLFFHENWTVLRSNLCICMYKSHWVHLTRQANKFVLVYGKQTQTSNRTCIASQKHTFTLTPSNSQGEIGRDDRMTEQERERKKCSNESMSRSYIYNFCKPSNNSIEWKY